MKIKILCFFLLVVFIGYGQQRYSIKGNFANAKNTELEFIGFQASKDTLFMKTQSDSLGNFSLSYPAQYSGAAVIKLKLEGDQNDSSLIVILNKENFTIRWSDLNDFDTLRFENSPENDALGNGMMVYQESEAILAGLKYLKPLYSKSPKNQQWVENEIIIQEAVVPNFLKKMAPTNYTKYYLPIRRLIEEMPLTVTRYPERMPQNEKEFKEIDFMDARLLHSGLFTKLIEGFFILMESHGDLDVVTTHTNAGIDVVLKSFNGNSVLKQEVAVYLFELLEKRSLFKSAEHVALAMLNDSSCSLDKKSIGLYEQYRSMGVGKKASEIRLTTSKKGIGTLGDISSRYKLIVFGSSWCTKCQEEMPQLKKEYQMLKDKYNLEIVFISLDTDIAQYKIFVNDFPWISSCDLKGWETQSAKDYFVFATPTMYLLDSENKILLKPFGTEHLSSWLLSNGDVK